MSAAELAAGLRSGDRVAVARTPAGVALAAESGATAWLPAREAGAGLVAIDQASRPRWVCWDAAQVIDGSIADAPGGALQARQGPQRRAQHRGVEHQAEGQPPGDEERQ